MKAAGIKFYSSVISFQQFYWQAILGFTGGFTTILRAIIVAERTRDDFRVGGVGQLHNKG